MTSSPRQAEAAPAKATVNLLFRAAQKAGLFKLARSFRPERSALVILCYHGISKSDEHRWHPGLYLAQDVFRRRLKTLRQLGFQVLPLAPALEQLRQNSLRQPAVVLTFDDGWQDFHSRAWPVLQEFQCPATVYQTSFYSSYNRPVFDTACSYLLWKGRGRIFRHQPITGSDAAFPLHSRDAAACLSRLIQRQAAQRQYTAEQKHDLLAKLAAQLGIDFDAYLASRLLQLMNASELQEISAGGIDVQLHSHRHYLPLDRVLFHREIEQNREWIQTITGKQPVHFCYPNGSYRPEFEIWLREAGVRSATTCEPGIASPDSEPLRLPRLTDSSHVSEARFEAWLSGVGLLPSACKRVILGPLTFR